MEKLCETCEKRNQCTAPCKRVQDILWKDNRVMERLFTDIIVCYPKPEEVHFSELSMQQLESFSSDRIIPWSSGDVRLRKTSVFIERFFNHVPYKELAERYGVNENTIVCMYRDAVESVEKIIEALDSRREGIKAMKLDRFTDDQKYFLLVCIFGFSGNEVARMFGQNRNLINKKIKRMVDRFGKLFSGENKPESPIEDPVINGKLKRADVVSLVDAYTEQGLSHAQAFKRIADRFSEVVGRPVNFRGIESKYYKATGKKKPGKSIHDGLSVSESVSY